MKLDKSFKVIHNVLSDRERKKIIKDVQPFLMNSEQMNIRYNNNILYPGKQTSPLLHMESEFISVMKKILDKILKETNLDLQIYRSWVKWSNGKENQTNWHSHYPSHPVWAVAVYYIKTLPFFNSGTLFEDGFVRAPQNSMIIFPAHLLHTTPKYPFPFVDRYVMSIDLS